MALIIQYKYLFESEEESFAEGFAAEVPEAFIRWVDPDKSFQQKTHRLQNLSHNQVYSHRHVDLLICNKPTEKYKTRQKIFLSAWFDSCI